MEKTGKDLAMACGKAARDIRAEDVRVFDVREVSTITDFLIVASGNSMPHLKAVLREVDSEVSQSCGASPQFTDGKADSRWVVLDYIDVMVHVMLEDTRELYALEKLWGDAIEITDELGPEQEA